MKTKTANTTNISKRSFWIWQRGRLGDGQTAWNRRWLVTRNFQAKDKLRKGRAFGSGAKLNGRGTFLICFIFLVTGSSQTRLKRLDSKRFQSLVRLSNEDISKSDAGSHKCGLWCPLRVVLYHSTYIVLLLVGPLKGWLVLPSKWYQTH